jgi:hypothetical protein
MVVLTVATIALLGASKLVTVTLAVLSDATIVLAGTS